MCHLLLALPLLALPLFWLLPLPVAVSLYLPVFLLAAVIYVYALAAARRPLEIGSERLRHAEGTVLDVDPVLRVRVDGESWLARCPDGLAVGDAVCVEALDGLTLRVRKGTTASQSATPAVAVQRLETGRRAQ